MRSTFLFLVLMITLGFCGSLYAVAGQEYMNTTTFATGASFGVNAGGDAFDDLILGPDFRVLVEENRTTSFNARVVRNLSSPKLVPQNSGSRFVFGINGGQQIYLDGNLSFTGGTDSGIRCGGAVTTTINGNGFTFNVTPLSIFSVDGASEGILSNCTLVVERNLELETTDARLVLDNSTLELKADKTIETGQLVFRGNCTVRGGGNYSLYVGQNAQIIVEDDASVTLDSPYVLRPKFGSNVSFPLAAGGGNTVRLDRAVTFTHTTLYTK